MCQDKWRFLWRYAAGTAAFLATYQEPSHSTLQIVLRRWLCSKTLTGCIVVMNGFSAEIGSSASSSQCDGFRNDGRLMRSPKLPCLDPNLAAVLWGLGKALNSMSFHLCVIFRLLRTFGTYHSCINRMRDTGSACKAEVRMSNEKPACVLWTVMCHCMSQPPNFASFPSGK
jgi:hypothetical protein